MVLDRPGQPLHPAERPDPVPADTEVRIQVRACAVCRTDLHLVDGELPHPRLPVVPGHQIVGLVEATGAKVSRFEPGDRVGVPWLGWTDGSCRFCATDRENLCPNALFTGYTRDGGYAEKAVADERYCFVLPEGYPDLEAAPLLCAGMIGYRALRMTGDARRLAFYGFGAAAHILIQAARHQGREVLAFTRPGDFETQDSARRLGATWAGDSTQIPPAPCDAAIIFAPVGALVPAALRVLEPGGVVVCAGIHMSDVPSFPYDVLWEERSIRSVANLTRRDGEEFLALAPQVPIRTEVTTFPLTSANEALRAFREGKIQGSAVLIP